MDRNAHKIVLQIVKILKFDILTCAEVNCTHHVVNAVGCAYIQIYAIVSPLELGNICARSMSQFITLYVHINFHLFQA